MRPTLATVLSLILAGTCLAQAPSTTPGAAAPPTARGGGGAGGGGRGGVDRPVPRNDANSRLAHEQLVAKARQGRIDVYFLGDSITRRWGATDYPRFLANWKENFFGWNAGNFGWGADRLENILWRIENGELEGVNPKVIVLLAGTNNIGGGRGGRGPTPEAQAADIARGLQAIVASCRQKAPNAVIILTGIFPRNDNPGANAVITRVNDQLATMADGKTIRYLNINDKLADKDGQLHEGMTVDRLHPDLKGYQVWADALKPILTEILGPPAKEDRAPPPTGDPSAAGRSNAPSTRPAGR